MEEAFHEITSPLALRPLFVTREARIGAHVMACVLAYDLDNTIENRLRLAGIANAPPTMLETLASDQMNRIQVKSTGQTRLTMTEPTAEQRRDVAALPCEIVWEDHAVHNALTAMKSWVSSRILADGARKPLSANGRKILAPNMGYRV